MRQAFELAWANAFTFRLTECSLMIFKMPIPFSKSRPFCMHMDDILFKAPVEVGNLLYFNSQICYTQDQYVQTRVSAEVTNLKIYFVIFESFCQVLNPKTGELSVTNVFHYTFLIKENKQPPTIIPKTYHEVHNNLSPFTIHSNYSFILQSMLYLTGRRHFKASTGL